VFTLSSADRPYRMIVENMRDGAATVSSEGIILYANSRLAELLSCSKETIVGAPLTRFIRAGEFQGPDGLGATIEIDLLNGDGVVIPVLVGTSTLEVDSVQLSCLTFTDLRGHKSEASEISRLEDQPKRERARAEAEWNYLRGSAESERLASLGLNAGQVAHDFNNLLIGIQGYAATIKVEIAAATAEREQRLVAVTADAEQIERTVLRAADLTRQLLGFIRREVVRLENFDLNGAIIEVEELLRRTAGKSVEFVVTLGQDVQPVHADHGNLERVLVNLVVNARDAMPGGGILTIETSNIDIDGHDASVSPGLQVGRYARLAVTDTGTGMTDAVIDHAFEPFFTTKAGGGGTGLGLATVYDIISQAGGHTQIDSEPAVGTTITILLPATEDIASTTPAAVGPSGGQGQGTVLVVEKDDTVRGVIHRILSAGGYEVLSAATGAQALKVAADHDGDIAMLITDVGMPGMLGKEFADILLATRPATAVLYTSDYPPGVEGRSQAIRPDEAVIEKPFSSASLLAAVRHLLDP
jgi:signal transduction histidine kinase/CheY-like chemotaxis protein